MRNKRIKMITIDALFIDIIILLTFFWGYIPSVVGTLTVVMVPVLLGAYLFGFKRGVMYGFVFGVTSLIRAAIAPMSFLDPYFVNPLVSVLPRLVFGLAAGLVLPLVKKIKDIKIRVPVMAISAFALTLFHSVVTLAMLGLMDGAAIAVEVDTYASYWAFMGVVIISSGLIEGSIAAVLVPTIAISLEQYMSIKNKKGKVMNYKEINKLNIETALANLQKWIAINSIDDSKTVAENKPFGEGVFQALQYIGLLALKDGFQVDFCDGYCTEITLGSGEKQIAIYAHADVVPVTGEWKHAPFSATIEDGVMYGRGTSDDKGPAMAAYFAIKAIKDSKVDLGDFRIVLVIGGNEEKGSKCLNHYFHKLKKPYPEYGFTPDGQFPLIYGEKGICNYQSIKEVDLSPVISIDAGVAFNSVIDKATVTLKKDERIETYLKNKKISYKLKHDAEVTTLVINGKSAHGSTPELGINAGLILLELLGDFYDLEILRNLANCYKKSDGENMGLHFSTTLLHDSTYNVGIIEYDKSKLTLSVNFRYPEKVDVPLVIKKVNEITGMETNLLKASEPLLIDPETPLVQTLLKVYQEETGDLETPIVTIGGGTYARESKNTLAFGSAFPKREDKIHEANENIHIEDFIKSMDIYASAILALTKL